MKIGWLDLGPLLADVQAEHPGYQPDPTGGRFLRCGLYCPVCEKPFNDTGKLQGENTQFGVNLFCPDCGRPLREIVRERMPRFRKERPPAPMPVANFAEDWL